MKRLASALLMAACLAAPSMSSDKAQMTAHFKAYRKALESKDMSLATKEAEAALDVAEDVLGDHKTTGDLAQNYGDLLRRSDPREAAKAYERALELVSFYPEDGRAEMHIDRAGRLAEMLIANNRAGKAKKVTQEALAVAEASGLANSTLSAELKVRLAQVAVLKGDHEDTVALARAAREAFEAADDGILTVEHYAAALYEGYGLEGQDDDLEAALRYQEVMQDVEGLLPRDHPFLMRAMGRWMTMRGQLSRAGKLEDALAAGVCECWPYDKARNEAVQPVKRVPPVMPRKAWQSGFAIMEFDLEDDGSTTNIRVLESWPKTVFDASAERAVQKWKYTARTPDETDGDRKDIITTVTYRLTDRFGNPIE